MAQVQKSRGGQPRRRRNRHAGKGKAGWIVALLLVGMAIGFVAGGAPGASQVWRQVANWLPADAPIRTAERTPRQPPAATPRMPVVVTPDRDPPRNVVRVIPLKMPPRDVARRPDKLSPAKEVAPVPENAPDRTVVGAIPRPNARIVPLCGSGARRTCVVDGDTFWLDGEKIRIVGIDAPEMKGRCRTETARAEKAKLRLRDILNSAAITLDRTGKDRFGRTLAHVRVGAGDTGDMLVREGLARPYEGRKAQWC